MTKPHIKYNEEDELMATWLDVYGYSQDDVMYDEHNRPYVMSYSDFSSSAYENDSWREQNRLYIHLDEVRALVFLEEQEV
jgi:hypothetical protein